MTIVSRCIDQVRQGEITVDEAAERAATEWRAWVQKEWNFAAEKYAQLDDDSEELIAPASEELDEFFQSFTINDKEVCCNE